MSEQNDDYWIPLADLMTGMMLIFLLISISLIVQVKHVASTYVNAKLKIYNELLVEFKDDLPKWNASLNKDDLSIRFNEPNILFATGKAELKPQFKAILSNFFPRYLKQLQANKKEIIAVKINGYTSSIWEGADQNQEYFLNMKLSQDRTREVLEYVYRLNVPNKQNYTSFIKTYLTANGLSSSHLIYNPDGTENIKKSQRVEFKPELNSDKALTEINKQKLD